MSLCSGIDANRVNITPVLLDGSLQRLYNMLIYIKYHAYR